MLHPPAATSADSRFPYRVSAAVAAPHPGPDGTSTGAATSSAIAPTSGMAAVGPYGLPWAMLTRAWTVRDITSYTGLSRARVYALMTQDGAPPRLRTGASDHRYNALQVLAWLNNDDWTQIGLRPAAMLTASQHQQPAMPTPATSLPVTSVSVHELRRHATAAADPGSAIRLTVRPSAVAKHERAQRLAALVRPTDGAVVGQSGRGAKR